VSYITAAELAQIRADVQATMDGTCSIYRKQFAVSETGYQKPTTASTVASGVACTLRPYRELGYRTIAGERPVEGRTWYLTLAHDQDIAVGDQVVYLGTTYEVKTINDHETNLAVKRVDLERAQ
jgi:hypothetical protein